MSFEKQCLDAHNNYRLQHGVEPLVLNSKLSKDAQIFAEQLLKEDALRNGDVKDLGENIYCVKSSNPNYSISGDKAVDHWYLKQSEHDYANEPSDKLNTGNFTQIVWRNSKELGIGHASRNGKVIVVARYSPPGNVRSQFCQNVFPRISHSTIPKETALPQTKSTSSGSKSANPFNTDCLNTHNNYRRKHGCPPLKLDDNLCRYSQEWADDLARRGVMQHRQQSDYGENIFSAWSSDPSYTIEGRNAVDSWYDEIKFYTFGREPTDLKSGHFTQVVWKDSQKLGVGVAKHNGHIYVVCNYSPPGNYVGNYIANVPAPH